MQENKYPHIWLIGAKNKICLNCRKINCDENEECMVAKREYLKDKDLRDEFAMAAIQMFDYKSIRKEHYELIARSAYFLADAMMKEREK